MEGRKGPKTYKDDQDQSLIQLLDFEKSGDQEDCDWGESLQHLDERNAQSSHQLELIQRSGLT